MRRDFKTSVSTAKTTLEDRAWTGSFGVLAVFVVAVRGVVIISVAVTDRLVALSRNDFFIAVDDVPCLPFRSVPTWFVYHPLLVYDTGLVNSMLLVYNAWLMYNMLLVHLTWLVYDVLLVDHVMLFLRSNWTRRTSSNRRRSAAIAVGRG